MLDFNKQPFLFLFIMNQKEAIKKIKEEIAKLKPFQTGCYVCGCSVHRRGMTFHHKDYRPDEKTYKDFGKNVLEYYTYLKPIIIKSPERFLYLCTPHHQALERLKRFSADKFEQLVRAVRMSR